MLFLAGGPGASSVAAAFMGTGPLLLKAPFAHDMDFTLADNPWSWTQHAQVVFVDQPRHTGYSYGSGPYVTTMDAAGGDFLLFLQGLYLQHPELQRSPLYLAGSSFGGNYLAQYAHAILHYNDEHPQTRVPLMGLLVEAGTIGLNRNVGGADTAPAATHLAYVCQSGLVAAAECDTSSPASLAGLFSACSSVVAARLSTTVEALTIGDLWAHRGGNFPACARYLAETNLQAVKQRDYQLPDDNGYPAPLRDIVVKEPLGALEFPEQGKVRAHLGRSPNPYDIRLACDSGDLFPPWCYDNAKLEAFFNSTTIRQRIGQGLIPPQVAWTFASFPVNLALQYLPGAFTNTSAYYTEALQRGLKVSLVFGKDDFIINYRAWRAVAGTIAKAAYGKELPELSSFRPARDSPSIGEQTKVGKLCFYQLDQAGHVIGLDQPAAMATILAQLLL